MTNGQNEGFLIFNAIIYYTNYIGIHNIISHHDIFDFFIADEGKIVISSKKAKNYRGGNHGHQCMYINQGAASEEISFRTKEGGSSWQN